MDKVEFRNDAAAQRLFELQAPFDDFATPLIGRFTQSAEFELQEVLDNVLAERLRGANFAASQILNLLSDQFGVELIAVAGNPRRTAA